ncbi:MAG: DUF2156 domain-containing protein [Clostridia bacterium]|nr:DUF2156 domain-containing protein [Clostridia bacterium]
MHLDFHPYDLAAAIACRPYFAVCPDRFCDWTVGGIYMWREYYTCRYAIAHGCLISAGGDERRPYFSVPLGAGDREAALAALEQHCADTGTPLRFATVSPADTAWLVERYGSDTRVIHSGDSDDYLYNYTDLATMAGRRYSGQRNHINQFIKKFPDWQYAPITADNVAAVQDFLLALLHRKQEEELLSPTELADITATMEILPILEKLSMTGGVITVNGEVAGFSVGEVLGDTLFVHAEKGDLRYPGIYQMLVREYAAHTAAPGLAYINREDDSGDEGLRRSKRSYHPCTMLEKNLVIPPQKG